MPKCTILVGLPGTGKSFWCNNQNSSVIISTDNTIQSIADEFSMTYNKAFPNLIKFGEQIMWDDLQYALENGQNVIIDRTNLTRKSRAKFIKFLQGYKFEAVVFQIPDDWQSRLSSRPGKVIPQEILLSMDTSYEEPIYAEGFDSIRYVEPSSF